MEINSPIPKDLRWLDGLDNELIVRIVSAEARIRELEHLMQLGSKELEKMAAAYETIDALQAQLQAVTKERDQMNQKLNTPELVSFRDAVVLEAAHQRERWGSEHDDGKQPADWFWLVGYLAGKALASHIACNPEKALHHTISTAAALANWHAAILGKTSMRPGIMEPKA